MTANAPPKRKTVKLQEPEPRSWTFDGFNDAAGNPQQIVQDRMTFFEKNEFMGLAASVIDDAIRGGLDVGRLVAQFMDQEGTLNESLQDVQKGILRVDALPAVGEMLMLLLRLLAMTPGKLEDAYMIALSIEPVNRPWFRSVLRAEPDDEKMFAIWQTFVEQNAGHLADFFARYVAQLRATSDAIRKAREQQSDGSPPSSG